MASDIRIAIIDGTGPWFDSTYAKAMAPSFCHQVAQKLGGAAYYQRGPSFDGMSDAWKMDDATNWLKRQRQINPTVRLMLAGYSRGGTVAIAAAEQLDSAKLPVDALFLFDAVARDVLYYGRKIPANVKLCRHARRSQAPWFVDKYEEKFVGEYGEQETSLLTSNPTRPSFGNTGTTFTGSVDYKERTFLGSHGALGGVGWKMVTEDAAAQVEVATWMTEQMTSQGLNVTLVSTPPTE